MDYTVHRILQARILEWVALPFSGDLPNQGIEPRSPALQADSLPAEPQEKRIHLIICPLLFFPLSLSLSRFPRLILCFSHFSMLLSFLFLCIFFNFQFSSVRSLSHVWLFATPWTAAHQASLSITNTQRWLFPSGGQSIAASALASVFPMNIQDWFPLGWTGLILLKISAYTGT